MQRRGFLAATLATPGLALAQEWPSGPIRGIVPFAPGSATDTVARLFAERMRDTLGQPVVIENRAGASGLIGAEAVARAPADGMTLLFGTNSTNAAANALFRRVPFDMERDFAPISMLASVPLLVAVPEASPHRTLNDLLAAARARPEAVTYASTSASQRVASEMLASMAGVRLLHVPYRAAGAAIQDLLAGRVDMFVADQAVILPASQSGRACAHSGRGGQSAELRALRLVHSGRARRHAGAHHCPAERRRARRSAECRASVTAGRGAGHGAHHRHAGTGHCLRRQRDGEMDPGNPRCGH
ncbi:MAG: tripartite tricarboxylate transporter substrate binding protein [Rhodospirillales bacterium]|nr:tripartite tricarboxylate transporter substrate binding protein [Rhodospirillales bacterium]